MAAWHFVTDEGLLRDGSKLVVGEWLDFQGEVVLCQSGLHASVRAIDALQYAPGAMLCRVELSGTIVKGYDKLAASRRLPLWSIDATEVLRDFSRSCASDVLHLWDPPDVVREYLGSGDETLRDAARAAARDAAWDATRAAARAAAWDAARAAAWDAARDAARAAVRAAARSAAWDAAWDAAWAAAGDAQNVKLEAMLYAAKENL